MRGLGQLLALLAALTPAGAVAAEPGFAKASVRSLFGDSAYDAEGERVRLPRDYRDHQLRLWGRWPLDETWALFGGLAPVGWATYESRSRIYFGGGSAGASVRLLRGPVDLELQAEFGARPEGPTLFSGVVEGSALRLRPSVGTLFGSAHLSALRGLGWGWVRAALGATGFSRDGLDPALDAYVQLGWTPIRPLEFDLHLSGGWSFGDLSPVDVLGNGQTRYLGLGLGVAWWAFEDLGVTASFDIGPFARSNAYSPALGLGLVARIPR